MYGAMTVASAPDWLNFWKSSLGEECPRWVGLCCRVVVGKMEALHGFGGGVSPSGVVAGKMRVAWVANMSMEWGPHREST
jgi:hypothetical protein